MDQLDSSLEKVRRHVYQNNSATSRVLNRKSHSTFVFLTTAKHFITYSPLKLLHYSKKQQNKNQTIQLNVMDPNKTHN